MKELLVMLPDALLFGSLCFLVLLAAFVEGRRCLTWAGILTVFAYLLAVHYQAENIAILKVFASPHLQSFFGLDLSALGMKQFAGVVTLAILIFFDSLGFKHLSEHGKEGVLVILFGLLGASLMVGASHYLMSYLGLELLSLALVVLIAWGLEVPQIEAGVKYFILSSLASGLLLFGVSLIYGSTGHLNFVSSSLVRVPFHQMYTVGQIFLIAGVAFKLGWAPFHFWVSDVYSSARWYTIVALGSLSKIGMVGFMVRLLDADVLMAPSGSAWAVQLIVVLSVLSILVGNIMAVQQKNIRRLLAYSSVANMGFLGLALVCRNGAPFYLAIYVLNTLAVVAILYSAFGQRLDASLDDLKGFALRFPYQGAVFAFTMLSMAGIPITPGFWAKWQVFKDFFAQYSPLFGVFIVLGTLVGLFYYLRVVKVLYEESEDHAISVVDRTKGITSSSTCIPSYVILLGLISIVLVWCAASPDMLLNWSDRITGGSKKMALDDALKASISITQYPVHLSLPATLPVMHPVINKQSGQQHIHAVIQSIPSQEALHAR